MLNSLARKFVRFRQDTRGNIAVIFALSILPILTAIGCAVDYSIEANTYAKLTAYADAAVLSAVNKAAMTGSTSAAQTLALNTFNAQASTVTNIDRPPRSGPVGMLV